MSDWSSDVCSSDLIEVAFVSARNSAAAAHRARDLGVRSCVGVGDNLACVERLAAELGIGLEQVSFMGDDLPDIRIMRAVGLAVAPPTAHAWTLERAYWRDRKRTRLNSRH